jgi:N-acetylglucosaminyldiphosphoundecaprenol N-acetyl-beta-D-mannosaminyltransferase
MSSMNFGISSLTNKASQMEDNAGGQDERFEKSRNGLGLSGVAVDDVLMQEALQVIEKMIEEGGTHQVATANVDYLVHATKDSEYRHILCMCDLVVADGMPIVWTSRLFGIPLRERVTGADMVPELVRLSGRKGYTIFLLGATAEVVEKAERQMQIMSPGVRVVGRMSPPVRPLNDFDNEPILAAIEEAHPDILLVAFGSPKQEKWISRNRHRLNVPVCIGIGGTLDFMAGTVKRAPKWMQKTGLEWIFRMCVDPVRLVPRYSADALWMVRYLMVQLFVQGLFRRPVAALNVSEDVVNGVNVVSATGAMTGSGLADLAQTLSLAIASGQSVVLDLSATSHLGADGLWTLAAMLRHASQNKSEVWLAGISRSLKRQLRAAHFEGLWQSADTVRDAIGHISHRRTVADSEPQVAGAA